MLPGLTESSGSANAPVNSQRPTPPDGEPARNAPRVIPCPHCKEVGRIAALQAGRGPMDLRCVRCGGAFRFERPDNVRTPPTEGLPTAPPVPRRARVARLAAAVLVAGALAGYWAVGAGVWKSPDDRPTGPSERSAPSQDSPSFDFSRTPLSRTSGAQPESPAACSVGAVRACRVRSEPMMTSGRPRDRSSCPGIGAGTKCPPVGRSG